MSISVGRSILGLLVISLSFISPWGKFPDPVCCSGHDWDMCPAIPPCWRKIFNNSEKSQTPRQPRVKDGTQELQDKLRELKQDVNKFTENRVNDAVEGLNSKLQQTENRLQELFQDHTKTIENLKKIEDEFEKYKQVTDNTIARIEQRCEETENKMKKLKKDVMHL
ncbi:hypothetical protein C0Q70_21746 [Pomacea canaliculata]|uniref:Uncharacterized protein n=1 Tax=Pomacea canaliculata TaxID=400727 RepID=A0A2T7NDE0_POMCA|nr:hypothetical protein C0Q70_21746 [Pomacea canaliculata]